MKDKKIKLISAIIFYGAIWGFLEATLGYSLQYLPSIISGTIMFPIATVILINAYNKTGSRVALLYIGVIAASIKAVDFFMPFISVGKTFNPMIAIIVESFLVVAVVTYLTSDKITHNVAAQNSITANFRKNPPPPDIVMNEINYNSSFMIYMSVLKRKRSIGNVRTCS